MKQYRVVGMDQTYSFDRTSDTYGEDDGLTEDEARNLVISLAGKRGGTIEVRDVSEWRPA